MGADAIRKLLRRLCPGREEGLVFDALPVLPPDWRPLVLLDDGNFATSDLNDLYRRVINQNNRLKKLIELDAPPAILCNEKALLQRSVDGLFDNGNSDRPVLGSNKRALKSLSEILTSNVTDLDEKSVEYCARGVVVPDSNLSPHLAIGLPEVVARELFQTLAIKVLKETGAADTIRAAKKLLEAEPPSPEARAALETAVASRPLLVMAADGQTTVLRPRLVEGEALRLHPDDARQLGITFAGEQVTLHLPLGEAAVRELERPSPCSDTESVLAELSADRIVELFLHNGRDELHPLDRIVLGIC